MFMKQPSKSDLHLTIEISGKVPWKKEFIQNPAQINHKEIILIDLNGLWIQYLLAVLLETSSEYQTPNVCWILSFSVNVQLHCTGPPRVLTTNFTLELTQQSVLSHLEDFKPKSFSKLNILNPRGWGGGMGKAEAIRKHAVFKQPPQFWGAKKPQKDSQFPFIFLSTKTVQISSCWLPPP